MRALGWLLLGLVGCSSSPVDTAPDGTDAEIDASVDASVEGGTTDAKSAFEAAGFTVGTGTFELVDLGACCAKGASCFGNNPSSPYATYRLPRAAGQTIANPNEAPDGTSTRWLLRADEAIVWLGTLPPKAAYFGFTNYLFGRPDEAGKRQPIFASLDETINEQVIAHQGDNPFGQRVAVIHGPDRTSVEKARTALIASGLPAASISVAPIDATSAHVGLADSADDFAVLFRVALFEDKAAGAAWLAKPPAALYRLTPKSEGPTSAYGVPVPRAKDTTAVEGAALQTALDDLEKAVIAKYDPTHASNSFPVDEGKPDPYACIAGKATCAGDNRDALYPKTKTPFLWLEKEDDFLIVYGVDHSKTGKAVYTSASVYALSNLVGVGSVTSVDWKDSAKDYLPAHADAGKLFAWKIARKCGADTHCLEIPTGDCPSGITAGQLAAIAFRVYVEPSTSTAPDPATLIRERVLRFKKR